MFLINKNINISAKIEPKLNKQLLKIKRNYIRANDVEKMANNDMKYKNQSKAVNINWREKSDKNVNKHIINPKHKHKQSKMR